jgi:hypothetical protein
MSVNTAASDGLLQSTGTQRRGPGSGGVTGRGFQPGVSGNAGGRAKPGSLDIAALARSHAPEAIAALVRGLDDPKHYVHAAQVLLDRGFGKPKQVIEGDVQSLTLQHLIAARDVAARIEVMLANGTLSPMIEGEVEPQTERTTTAMDGPPDLMTPALE